MDDALKAPMSETEIDVAETAILEQFLAARAGGSRQLAPIPDDVTGATTDALTAELDSVDLQLALMLPTMFGMRGTPENQTRYNEIAPTYSALKTRRRFILRELSARLVARMYATD